MFLGRFPGEPGYKEEKVVKIVICATESLLMFIIQVIISYAVILIQLFGDYYDINCLYFSFFPACRVTVKRQTIRET